MDELTHFPVMDLPAEIRLLVLEHSFGYNCYPKDQQHYHSHPYSPYEVLGPVGPTKLPYRRVIERIEGPNTDILLLNKQIHDEIKDFAVYKTRKCFQTRLNLRSYTISNRMLVSPSPAVNRLQIVELELSHIEFMHEFNTEFAPFAGFDQGPGYPRRLSYISFITPQLKHLTLRFRSPIFGAFDDPWRKMGGLRRGNPNFTATDWRGNHESSGFHTTCQKILIDWILVFAKEQLVQIPKVTLAGYIKNSTKAKWDKILEDEKNGIIYDCEPEKRVIRNWPITNLGPKCHCSTPCEYDKVYKVHQKYTDLGHHNGAPEEMEELIDAYKFDYED